MRSREEDEGEGRENQGGLWREKRSRVIDCVVVPLVAGVWTDPAQDGNTMGLTAGVVSDGRQRK